MSDYRFKFIDPKTMRPFDETNETDAACEAEKRAMCDHFVRRMKKNERRGRPDGDVPAIVIGGMTALCGLLIASAGQDGLKEDALDRLQETLAFCWMQALSHGNQGGVQ